MSRWVCPECGENEDIVQRVAFITEYRGKFNEVGDIDDPDGDCVDSYTESYFCMSCNEEFDRPEEVEDEKAG